MRPFSRRAASRRRNGRTSDAPERPSPALAVDMITIAQIIHDATSRLRPIAGDDARLETELLLAHVLRMNRTRLLATLSDAPSPDALAGFESLLERRLSRVPLAYITGHREFYGIEFECTPAALIPRPETELLVEIALHEVGSRSPGARILDVGTGAGAIAVAIAANAASARVTASDASSAALALSRRNAASAGVAGRIDFRCGDLLEGAAEFDIIVANLPYVSEGAWRELPPEIRDHEPKQALVGGARGTEVIEQLFEQAPPHLAPGGVLAAEIGADQADAVISAARRHFPDAQMCVMKDLSGLDRVVVVRVTGG